MHRHQQSENWNHTHCPVKPPISRSMQDDIMAPRCSVMPIIANLHKTEKDSKLRPISQVFAQSHSITPPLRCKTITSQNIASYWTNSSTIPPWVSNNQSSHITAILRSITSRSKLIADIADLQHATMLSHLLQNMHYFQQTAAMNATKSAIIRQDVCIGCSKPERCSQICSKTSESRNMRSFHIGLRWPCHSSLATAARLRQKDYHLSQSRSKTFSITVIRPVDVSHVWEKGSSANFNISFLSHCRKSVLESVRLSKQQWWIQNISTISKNKNAAQGRSFISSHNKRRSPAKSESRPLRCKNKLRTAPETTRIAIIWQKASMPLTIL